MKPVSRPVSPPPSKNEFKPPADAKRTDGPNGGSKYTTKNGTEFETDKSGRVSGYKRGETRANFRTDGRVSSIHTKAMDINHGVRGGRTVLTRLPDGGRVVGFGHGRGFIEHPFNRGGRSFIRRTYWGPHGAYARVYGRYLWHGAYYGYYVHPFFYAPAFYQWAYNPWAAPVYWGVGVWGWGPWYGSYGGYLAPNLSYPSPAYWLTDYLIAASLQAAYADEIPVGGPEVVVPGNQAWTDTGTFVNADEEIAITASGGVSMGAGWAPYPPAGGPQTCSGGGFPAPQFQCWSLIGRVGDGPIFYVGDGTRLHAPSSGELLLGVNDNILGDNTGNWVANIVAPTAAAVSAQVEDAPLAFVPIFADGTKDLGPGFSKAGDAHFADDRIFLHSGATVSFSFSVPMGQVRTVAYGIPTGGHVNNAPAEISVNGVTVGTLSQHLGGLGSTTPMQLPLWRKKFDPGDYVLTIRSGGNAVNVYGLWLSQSSGRSEMAVSAPIPGETTAINPLTKKLIAEEVQRQLEAEHAAASDPQQMGAEPTTTPGALDPKESVFVVSMGLNETANGQECGVSAGDIITRLSDTPDANQNVTVRVLSSKSADCSVGAEFAVAVRDLQEMYNHFQEQLDAGMGELKKNQGKNGMPTARGANVAPTNVADGQTQPDGDAEALLQQQETQANQTEQQVTGELTTARVQSTNESNIDANFAGRHLVSVSDPLPSGSAIHSVDFLNFDYPSDCWEQFDGFPRSIHVSEGEWKKEDVGVFGVAKPASKWMISYGDLRGDGKEGAVVVTSCQGPVNFDYEEIFVFALSSGVLKVLARLAPSDWGPGTRIYEVHVAKQQLIVQFLTGGARCCPDTLVTTRFRWNGNHFARTGSDRKPYNVS
ncbi:MAG: hypothetical protein WA172_10115 [Terriglobales bacterium]